LSCHSGGSIAATVNNPSGGMDAFRETKRTACLKLQNVSGVRGLTRSIFIKKHWAATVVLC
jgi:hypothetical protein